MQSVCISATDYKSVLQDLANLFFYRALSSIRPAESASRGSSAAARFCNDLICSSATDWPWGGGEGTCHSSELARQGLAAGRVGIKVRFADQGTQSRSRALSEVVVAAGDMHAVALALLDRTQVGSRRIRGLGLQLGKLAAAAEADRQLELFSGGR